MGADFLMAVVPMEETSIENAKKKLRQYDSKFLIQHLEDNFCQLFYDEDGKTEYEQALEWVDEQIDEVYSLYVNGGREIGLCTVKDIYVMVTGGMSWGDEPTDAFLPMSVVQSLDLTLKAPVLQLDGGGKH